MLAKLIMAKKANSAAGCKEVMNEILISLYKDEEYMLLLRGKPKNPREFNELLLSFLERTLNKYEGNAKMLDNRVPDAEKTNLEEEILANLEPVFENKLVSLRNEIISSAHLQVRTALERFREPKAAVNDVVSPYMDKFDTECPQNSDAHMNFRSLLRDHRKELESEVVTFTQREAESINMQANNTNNTQANNTNNTQVHFILDFSVIASYKKRGSTALSAAGLAVSATLLVAKLATGDFSPVIEGIGDAVCSARTFFSPQDE